MNADTSILEKGETVAAEFRRHWIVPMRAAVVIGVLGALPFTVWSFITLASTPRAPYVGRILFFTAVLWAFVLWIALFVKWTQYWLARWYVTDRRIIGIGQRGIFIREATSIALSKVESASARTEGPAQSLLHFGNLEIEGGAGERILVADIPHPEAMQRAVQEATMHTSALQEENERGRQTLKIVAHEVKGYLAHNVALLSGIVAGDFGSVSDPLKGFAGRALSSTREGVGALKDILESSTSGAASLHTERFDLREEVSAIAEREKPAAAAKGLTLEITIYPEPCMVEGDREKLRERVLRNIVENAINYTPAGRITLGTTIIEGAIVFWSEDTGVGIDAETMEKLFTEGGHGTHSQEVNPHSTGFGLFAAKQLVEAHGGRIWAESDGSNKGSRFYVVLPCAPKLA